MLLSHPRIDVPQLGGDDPIGVAAIARCEAWVCRSTLNVARGDMCAASLASLSAAADVTCPIVPHRLEENICAVVGRSAAHVRNNLRPSCVKKTCVTFPPFDSLIARVSVSALKSPQRTRVSSLYRQPVRSALGRAVENRSGKR